MKREISYIECTECKKQFNNEQSYKTHLPECGKTIQDLKIMHVEGWEGRMPRGIMVQKGVEGVWYWRKEK